MGQSRFLSKALVAAALLALPALGVAADVGGEWSYETSESWNKGPCPVGKAGSGKIEMTQDGDAVTLVFLSGRKCRPKSMCTFEGTLSGNELVVSNEAKVDDEGGMVKNAITLNLSGNDAAAGSSESSYTHPGGMECRWGSKVTLTR
jgi:hypothetical protein